MTWSNTKYVDGNFCTSTSCLSGSSNSAIEGSTCKIIASLFGIHDDFWADGKERAGLASSKPAKTYEDYNARWSENEKSVEIL